MPSPRYSQIDIDATPYYHCISRCVRRAFLCGEDPGSGRNFDHRKGWVVEKLAVLSGIFGIDVCAYGVLSNHFHLVLHIDAERARTWADDEVVERYTALFSSQRDPRGHLSVDRARERIHLWRARLVDLSWFMRCLNESIARRANHEDGCTGRFWEGRFRSRALLDEAGLLTCMSYVDLNPVRAGIAGTLEDSDFTSIQQRLLELGATPEEKRPDGPMACPKTTGLRLPALREFATCGAPASNHRLPLDLEGYVELLRSTVDALRSSDPRPECLEPVAHTFDRLGIRADRWVETLLCYHQRFFSMVGCVHQIEIYCARTDRDRAKGHRWAARAFRSSA